MVVHFQILPLPRQLYIWIGMGTPNMANLCLAMPTRLVRPGTACARRPAAVACGG